jgi:hypothetical protein
MSKDRIKEFDWYLVFHDDRGNYVMGYGYESKPAIMDMKYALDALAEDQELIAAIPDFHKVMDYICFGVMNYKKFAKYIVKQEEKMTKEEDNIKKKKKGKNK